MKTLKRYLKTINGISHITLNPYGPGAVRIHLIPPKRIKLGITWVVILNGQDVLPLTTGWAILLREFINTSVEYSGVALTEDMIDQLIKKTIDAVSTVFPKTKKSMLKKDLKEILSIITDISKGKAIPLEIGYMTLSKYAKYMSAPHRMDLMISSMNKDGKWHCNQKCLHCYASCQEMAIVNELTTEKWKEIIDKCKEANIPQITFTGGEPTLRQDLVELVKHASWFVTRLNTNGVLLTKELCQELKEASLDSVQVTLYSYDENIHNTLVGANNFNKTIEGIKNAIEAGLNVSINTPLCKLNSDYVKTIEFAQMLGILYYSCSGLIMTGNSLNEQAQDTYLTKEEMISVLTKATEYCYENGLEISFTSPGWVEEEILRKLKLIVPSCGACLSNMAVAPDGTVVPCQSWLTEDKLGNMLEDDWKDIWNHPKTKEIRKHTCKYLRACPLASKRGDK